MLLLVTDIDLREHGALGRVENFLARSTNSVEELEGVSELGQERDIWLAFSGPVPTPSHLQRTVESSEASSPTDPSAFKIVMVDHAKRSTLPHIDSHRKETEDEVSFRKYCYFCC